MNTEIKQVNAKFSPVFVTEIKTTSDPEVVQLKLEQIVEEEVASQNALLAFTMKGHSAFVSNKKPRVAYQNFSPAQVEALGLKENSSLSSAPGITKARLIVTESLTPNSWFDKTTGEQKFQKAKTAGPDGPALTIEGNPIYRNTSLAINDMPMVDTLIAHDNQEELKAFRELQKATAETTPGLND